MGEADKKCPGPPPPVTGAPHAEGAHLVDPYLLLELRLREGNSARSLPGERRANLRGSDEAAPGELSADTRGGEHLALDLRCGFQTGTRTPSTERVFGLAGLPSRGRGCASQLAGQSTPVRGEYRDLAVSLGDVVNEGEVRAALTRLFAEPGLDVGRLASASNWDSTWAKWSRTLE